MEKFVNQLSRVCYDHGLGLLVIRVAAGIIFFMHGLSKVQNIQGTEHMFVSLGFGAGIGLLIAWLELIGGLALILGIATRFFGLVFGIEMTVAALHVGVPHGSYEMEMLLAAVSYALALAGSGKYSIYKMECNYCGGMLCKGRDCRTA